VHEHEEGHALWSTPEEERTFRLVRDLLMEMRDRGRGIYILPVQEGMETYGVDGWAVGEYSLGGGQDLAVGPWLEQVVEAARAAATG
jgi:hypothetical protein